MKKIIFFAFVLLIAMPAWADLTLEEREAANVFCKPSTSKKGNYYPAYRDTGEHIIITQTPTWAPSIKASLLRGIPKDKCEYAISAATKGYVCYSERSYGTTMIYLKAEDHKKDIPEAHDNLEECVKSAQGAVGDLFCSRDIMDQKVSIDAKSKKALFWVQKRNKWYKDRFPEGYVSMDECNKALAQKSVRPTGEAGENEILDRASGKPPVEAK